MEGIELKKQYKAGRRDFSGAYLKGADLRGASLSEANLFRADLSGANFSGADLSGANLSEASLSEANLFRADLSGANLSGVKLIGADFSYTNLSECDFNNTDLSGVNFSGTNLSRVQALNANLEGATLTGACIEDWNYNNATNLNNIICDYVYLKHPNQERRPSSGKFVSGDFKRLFQKAVETVDLIFRDGIDWQSFAASFQELQKEQRLKVEGGESQLSIQAIESRDDGSFVIRVNAPAQLDKAEIEESFKHKYEKVLEAREAEYRQQLQAYEKQLNRSDQELKHKDEIIQLHKQQGANMMEITKLLASKTIDITAIATSENRNTNTEGGNYNEQIKGDYHQ